MAFSTLYKGHHKNIGGMILRVESRKQNTHQLLDLVWQYQRRGMFIHVFESVVMVFCGMKTIANEILRCSYELRFNLIHSNTNRNDNSNNNIDKNNDTDNNIYWW